MTAVFNLSEFGQTFATRERGTDVREEFLRRFADDAHVVVDLAGVTNLSYSFADEFFGKLAAGASVRVSRTNGVPRLEKIVSRAIERRDGCAVAG